MHVNGTVDAIKSDIRWSKNDDDIIIFLPNIYHIFVVVSL